MNTRALLLLVHAVVVSCAAMAQIDVDRPLVLTGPADSARRVMGLSDATAESDALNARSAALGRFRAATVGGTPDAWNADLAPALTGPPDPGHKVPHRGKHQGHGPHRKGRMGRRHR